jgi:prepilin-type N-terminal cleavage/methylation domain-containing protein
MKKQQTIRHSERGFTMLEMLIATAIFFIGITGLMALATVAIAKTSGHGDQGTKTVEFAEDKMEQILALSYSSVQGIDTTTDLTQSSINSLTQSTSVGLTANPSCVFTTPSTCYVDYVSFAGVASNSPANAAYMREWRIVDDSLGYSKSITVYVVALSGADYSAARALLSPSATLVAVRTLD